MPHSTWNVWVENPETRRIAETGFEPVTFGVWARQASRLLYSANQDGRTCTLDTLIKYQLLCLLSYALMVCGWSPVYEPDVIPYTYRRMLEAAGCMPLASGYTITFWKRKTGKNGKTYAAFIKFSYSFLTLSAVARLPILIATSPLLFERISLFRKSREPA